MADLELEGYTLGQKHQRYNTLVHNALKENKKVTVDDFNLGNSDIVNLLNIDIANHNKNVEYILKVLTCDDLLYVSRAMKQLNWLINDKTYAHIINPKYLEANVFPQMTTKAKCKFVKYIRNVLNDEKRAEEFYFSEVNPKEAVKWLPRCSLEFVNKKITDHVHHMKITLLKRLCEKSITVLEVYMNNEATCNKKKALQATMFLLSTHTNEYLDIVERGFFYDYPNFNHKTTSAIMKNNSERIINKIDNYYNVIHLPTFIKYLKRENIKNFLLSQAQKLHQNNLQRLFNLKRLLLFIKYMPQAIRFDFVRDVFIDKPHASLPDNEKRGMDILYQFSCNLFRHNDHIWYQFAPFDVAFRKVKEFIEKASSAKEKTSLLEVLLISAQHDLSHEHTMLQYFRDKQYNIDSQVKEQFIMKLLSESNFVRYHTSTWVILNDILTSMDIYTESKSQQPIIIDAIILYKVIHEEKVPEVVENKFNFKSLASFHPKITQKEKEMVFLYLYNIIMTKLSKSNTTNEKEFKEKINLVAQALNLLKDYEKDLEQYPILIKTVKDLITVKKELSWTAEIETLFNIKKTWRKIFFEQSLVIFPTESAIINALKHGPILIEEHQTEVKNILNNDTLLLSNVLNKLKIYWCNSFAKNVTLSYIKNLKVLGSHRATTRGLSILLSRSQLHELIQKYAPKEAKIDWDKTDEVELSVQQQFAKNMHIARQQPSPEIIILFAKGDYLQYALPSLLSIFYNLNVITSRKYIPKLLDAPVSLQKHGIRLAVSKMEINEVLSNFSNIWKNNKNVTIRCVMFKTVFEILCKEKDPKKIKSIWELINMFLNNLTLKEDKEIYKLLFEVKNVPIDVRGEFYMKSYNFLHKLLNSGTEYKAFDYEFNSTFAEYAINIIEHLRPDFVAKIILEFIDKEFMKGDVAWTRCCIIKLITAHLLISTDETIQLGRYEKILLPVLKQCFTLWDSKNRGEYFIRKNLRLLLHRLRCDIKEYDIKKIVIPKKMFSLIQKELEQSLTIPDNYVLMTSWKLVVTFIESLDLPVLNWEEACDKIAPDFGLRCNDYLRDDCNKYFSRIYLLFVKALKHMLDNFIPEITHFAVYKYLVLDANFLPGYLAAIKLYSQYPYLENPDKNSGLKRAAKEIRKTIFEHPAAEIKIHYYNQFYATHALNLI